MATALSKIDGDISIILAHNWTEVPDAQHFFPCYGVEMGLSY